MFRVWQALLLFICNRKHSVGVILLVFVPSVFADSHTDDQWIEEPVIQTEWLEQVVAPVSRWMEQRIQGEQNHTPVVHEAPKAATLPTHVISPTEAARLLTLLFPGEVLRIQLLDTQPVAYSIKLLSEQGAISGFYIDAADGTLLENRPPLASDQPQTDNKETSDENSDR